MDKCLQEALDNALNSVTTDEVLQGGEILEDSGEYESYYSDSCGGEYTQLKIVKFKGNLYVYKEKVIEDHYLNQKRECVAFYELK